MSFKSVAVTLLLRDKDWIYFYFMSAYQFSANNTIAMRVFDVDGRNQYKILLCTLIMFTYFYITKLIKIVILLAK